MDVSITLTGNALARFGEMPGLLRDALMKAALGIAVRGAADLRDGDTVPRWTNNLADGMRGYPTATGASLLVPAEYARYVHDGRQPGKMPNIDNLADWATVHGMAGAEWAIAKKIAAKGIKKKPFLENYVSSMAFEAMAKRVLRGEVADALD